MRSSAWAVNFSYWGGCLQELNREGRQLRDLCVLQVRLPRNAFETLEQTDQVAAFCESLCNCRLQFADADVTVDLQTRMRWLLD